MSKQKRKDYRAAGLLAALLVLTSLAQSHARSQNQSAPVGKTEPAVIHCPLDVVTIEVRVTDPRGGQASSLERDDFIIYDNGVERQIRLWAELEGASRGDGEAVYALAYAPANLPDGKLHRIRVVARDKNKRKLKVKLLSPEGYDAKENLQRGG